MNKEKFCNECGKTLTEQNTMEFNGNAMCQDCYDRLTISCDNCGERIWASDAEGNGNVTVCIHCYDNYYTHCENCGILIHCDSAFYEDNSDYPYCEHCYNARMEAPIKPYNHKPCPVFHGSGTLYMGVELEIDKGGEISENAEAIIDIANTDNNHIYCKHDGSIDDGFEMVSHPMTLEYHTKGMNWREVFEQAVSMGYRSHQTTTCGLHIHVNRSAFGDSIDEQEEAISKIIYLVENHWNELVRFSRRTEMSLTRWANRYGILTTAKETYKSAKGKHYGRYVAVNLENDNTIEFRLFRGTLNYDTFLATLQLIDEICNLAIHSDDKDIESLSWSLFVSAIDTDKKPELIQYLKDKRLYVNESTNEREEM